MAAVRHLGFSYFRNICQKFKLAHIFMPKCKIWWRSADLQPSYCTLEGLRERTEYIDIYFFFPPITQSCSVSNLLFTGGRAVSDFSVL